MIIIKVIDHPEVTLTYPKANYITTNAIWDLYDATKSPRAWVASIVPFPGLVAQIERDPEAAPSESTPAPPPSVRPL